MDSLELYLKLDKMDPTLVPESSVKHKNDCDQKMSNDWAEVDGKGKQLIKDVTDVSKHVISILYQSPDYAHGYFSRNL